jgi:hypothetical protein
MDSRAPRTLQRTIHWAWPAAYFAAPLLLTGLLYAATLDQPYFWDDVPHFHFVTSRTYLQLWTDVRGMSYYRPLAFTLYKLYFTLAPHGVTVGAHLILLLAHTGNAALTGFIAAKLVTPRGDAQSRFTGLIATLLFATCPFAALPIAHFAAVMHPLVMASTLGAVLAALAFARSRRRRDLAIALLLALLAPFWHESGIMAGTIAATVALLASCFPAQGRPVLDCPWRALLLLPAVGALFLPVWLVVPRTVQPSEPASLAGMAASLTFFFQAPTFPAQPLSRWLIDRLGTVIAGPLHLVAGVPWWHLALIWGIGLLTLALAGVFLWRRCRRRILAIALAWTLLAALPATVALPFSYVTVSQRLLYFAAPPAAILWAAACHAAATRAAGRRLVRRALALALAALVAGVPTAYVAREIVLHRLALAPLTSYARIARARPGARHLVVNPPNWVNYRHPWYPLGHEGVSVSADYVRFDHLVQLNSQPGALFVAATVPAIRAELPHYYYSTIGEDTPWTTEEIAGRAPRFDRVWLTRYSEEEIAVEEAGSVRLAPPGPPPDPVARFGSEISLVSATLEVEEATGIVTLDWYVKQKPPDVTAFCHVYDCQAQRLGQWDGPALGRTLPFAALPPDSAVHDVRRVPLEAPSPDGCYWVHIGLYRPDGTRLHATTAGDERLADDAASLRFLLGPNP